MKSFFRIILLSVPLFVPCLTGCSEPDPRANPDFNEEAFNDPSAVKLDRTTKPKK